MMRAFLLGSASLLAVAVTAPAQAELLFQSIPDLTVGTPYNSLPCSSCGHSYQVYDTFTLASAATIGRSILSCGLTTTSPPTSRSQSRP